jgi:phosphohistidine phosphatase
VLFGKIMRIFVMRHGQAQSFASSDQNRELTEHGRYEAETMANYLVRKKQHFDTIFVSPYVRAQQTAKIVQNTLSISAPFTTLDFITPEDSALKVHHYIGGVFSDGELSNRKEQQILIVSHMPLVSYLVAEFTGGQHAPLFQTASIAEIEYDVKTMVGQLIAHTAPAHFKGYPQNDR